jgi:hypothetical protein
MIYYYRCYYSDFLAADITYSLRLLSSKVQHRN